MVLWQVVFLFLAAYADRDGLATKSHSTTTQYRQLRRLPTNRQIFVTHFLMTYCYLHFSDSQVWRCGTHTDNTQMHDSTLNNNFLHLKKITSEDLIHQVSRDLDL